MMPPSLSDNENFISFVYFKVNRADDFEAIHTVDFEVNSYNFEILSVTSKIKKLSINMSF